MIVHPEPTPAAPAPVPATGRREFERAGGSAQRWDAAIRGMVEKGLGVEAITTILGLLIEEALDRAVALSLPTPHDRPMRRSAHPRAWPVLDMRVMIECWLDGWDAGSMSVLFERSKAGIYGLRRRLNLPRRERSRIRRPGAEAFARRQRQRIIPECNRAKRIPDLPKPLPLRDLKIVRVSKPPPEIETLQRGLMGGAFPLAPMLQAQQAYGGTTIGSVLQPDGSALRVERKAGRNETLWTLSLDLNLAYRVFAKQHYRAIAADLGIPAAAVRSRMTRLGLPTAPRHEQRQHFDHISIIEGIESSGHVLRRCSYFSNFYFWSHRDSGQRRSPAAIKSRSFKKAQAAMDAASAY